MKNIPGRIDETFLSAKLREEIQFDKHLTKREERLLMKKVCEGVTNKDTQMHILKREEFPFDNLLDANFYYHGVSIFSLLQFSSMDEQWWKQGGTLVYSHFFYYHGKYYLCVRMRRKK